MKKEIHPNYEFVIYRDKSADFTMLSRTTLKPKGTETLKWEDGNEYPVIDVEISSASHPFFTGNAKIVDTAGRVEKFNKRFKKA
jgi:large subunit ribosomal protein L31